jgi:uncharacterized membrane protein YhiD involved in acid resistance
VEKEYVDIVEHLLIALAAGGLIGFERSYHGRPAGFRTHTLVCVASIGIRKRSPGGSPSTRRGWRRAS